MVRQLKRPLAIGKSVTSEPPKRQAEVLPRSARLEAVRGVPPVPFLALAALAPSPPPGAYINLAKRMAGKAEYCSNATASLPQRLRREIFHLLLRRLRLSKLTGGFRRPLNPTLVEQCTDLLLPAAANVLCLALDR